jgi:flagellar M-ring protein FliF
VNIDQLFTHLRKLVSTLSAGQIAGLVSVFVAVVSVVAGSAYWISQPTYQLLVADMDAETASAVVARLEDDNIPYQLGSGGRTVSVPAERIDTLRLQLASGGLPSAGRIGFEIFDRPAFGTTEFLEHVNYRRALEGELARTIGTLSEVSSARVHIAMARDSLFVDRDQPAKASVVLRLKNSGPLEVATAKAIANLVAGSVEALKPEAVVIVDTFGRPLTRGPEAEEAGLSSTQLERQRQIERDLTTRVVALLEPVVGDGRVRVNVAAHLNTEAVEETEESFDPASVVRSRQTMQETGASSRVAGGVSGARANQPPALSTALPNGAPEDANDAATAQTASAAAAAPAPAPAANTLTTNTSPGRTSETTNYEVGRTTRHTVSPQGALARLSVAVILDDERVTTKNADGTLATTTKPWEAEGKQRIHGLVAAAVGLDTERGDLLTVENIAFDVPQALPEPEPTPVTQQAIDVVKDYWPAAVRGVGIFALAAFALFGILRPLSRRLAGRAATPALPAAAGPSARLPTIKEMENQIEAELSAATGQAGRLPVLTKRVAKLANDEPEQLARIVRGWISDEQR